MKAILILLCLSLHCKAETIYITGELESKQTQHVLMPTSSTFRGKISEMVEEGSFVKKGDFILRIDGSSIDNQIEAKFEDLEAYKSTSKRSEIEFQIQLNQALLAHDRALTNFEIAKMNAETPLNFIGEKSYKENQLKLKTTDKILKKSINDLKEIKVVIKNNIDKIAIGLAQKQKLIDFDQNILKTFTINAKQDGYVVYASQRRSGEKIQDGDQVFTGSEIMSISQNHNLQIVAFINALDIPKLEPNQLVNIQFDAYMNQDYQGRITSISSGGEDKQIWGDGLYYKAKVNILNETPDNLLIGMSAQVSINLKDNNNE